MEWLMTEWMMNDGGGLATRRLAAAALQQLPNIGLQLCQALSPIHSKKDTQTQATSLVRPSHRPGSPPHLKNVLGMRSCMSRNMLATRIHCTWRGEPEYAVSVHQIHDITFDFHQYTNIVYLSRKETRLWEKQIDEEHRGRNRACCLHPQEQDFFQCFQTFQEPGGKYCGDIATTEGEWACP